MPKGHKTYFFVKTGEILVIAVAMWFLSWLAFQYLELWQYVTNIEFQNLLFVSIAVEIFTGLELLARKAGKPKTAKPTNNPKGDPELAKTLENMEDRLDFLSEQMSDLNAFKMVAEKKAKHPASLPHVPATFSEELGITDEREKMVKQPLIKEIPQKKEEEKVGQS